MEVGTACVWEEHCMYCFCVGDRDESLYHGTRTRGAELLLLGAIVWKQLEESNKD